MSPTKDNLFEVKMARLQEIVSALESGDLPLEKGMALYKEGAECSRFCRKQLEKARHELSLWQDGELKSLEVVNDLPGGAEEKADQS
ncbi:exodeoxyribonuclease VII small subunit [Desulfovibrio sp. ZJ369]|uniref:exodeoxyribonuclease VII small subunit n=1 Tax=Desulfovibrio sp. ZJ369 TaxID=2709793 RepID=UPI0013EB600C|nr:exodeoxyribonuclease VII small subunit [Desulfovibrio sp. ZJ369]